jgi:site-specific recombinase XerD
MVVRSESPDAAFYLLPVRLFEKCLSWFTKSEEEPRPTCQKQAISSPQFFLTKDRSQIKAGTASKTFQKVRKKAGVARDDGARYQPRMQDLRYTFAVHRLTAWFKHGADMGRMIPALSAYMGHHDLGAAERYLRLTPERFRTQLNKLSPQRGKKRWRDDTELMRFLDSL